VTEDSGGGAPVKVLVCCWIGEAILLTELAMEMVNEEEDEEDEENERRIAQYH
jgi:hypothetical protein